ncbi:MAG: heat-inducible transcription repressor HrcA [Chloroflexi bacterium]|jgi:heat-inducible transcriptional repressor|nr:heat-inducible transcription repressor HrcA [Chloroflexota bacterium]
MNQLSDRQKIILSLVVHEHTRTAQPVASKSLINEYNLKISSATVRNEMNALEEMGFLRQPHTSAGRVPTEEGYRFFVSNLVQHTSLPSATRNTIAHQFYQARRGLEHWLPLAASVLANQSQAVSIVTAPHSQKVTFKHLELIATRGSQVLMVLVLVGGEIQQQILAFDTVQTQEQLSQLATQVNQLCENRALEQIQSLPPTGNPAVDLVLDAIEEQLNLTNKLVTGELYLDGLSYVLSEPVFADYDPANSPLRLLEERSMLDDLISRTVLTEDIGGVQVLIGGEGTWQELQNTSVILTRYGIPDQLSGTLGILGPMRMPYGQTISTVRYVGELMSGFVADNLID